MFRPVAFAACLFLAVPAAAADPIAPPDEFELQAIEAVAKLGGEAEVNPSLDAVARVAVKLERATDATLTALSKLPPVGSVEVTDASKVTAKGLTALKDLPDLQKLTFHKSLVGDPSAAVIGTIRTLQWVYLPESKITDKGLADIAKLPDLQFLDLIDAKVTDRGVALLADAAKLQDLNLSGSKVTDGGIVQLKVLKRLKVLRVVRTDVTRKGTDELEKALPKLVVRQ